MEVDLRKPTDSTAEAWKRPVVESNPGEPCAPCFWLQQRQIPMNTTLVMISIRFGQHATLFVFLTMSIYKTKKKQKWTRPAAVRDSGKINPMTLWIGFLLLPWCMSLSESRLLSEWSSIDTDRGRGRRRCCRLMKWGIWKTEWISCLQPKQPSLRLRRPSNQMKTVKQASMCVVFRRVNYDYKLWSSTFSLVINFFQH